MDSYFQIIFFWNRCPFIIIHPENAAGNQIIEHGPHKSSKVEMKRTLCVVKEVIRKLEKMWDPSHASEQELKLGKFKINFPCEKGSYLL